MAQFKLGWFYDTGQGVGKDLVEAVKWFRKAAEQNIVEAQFNLALNYQNGQGVEKDSIEAVKWYRKAAEQNFVMAQCNLGVCYQNGVGVEKDISEAAKWYRKAAEQGVAWAQYQLGRLYYFGDGVLLDYAEAVKWNALAAAQGNEDAVNMWNYVLKEKIPSDQIAEGQRRAHEFIPRKQIADQLGSISVNSTSPENPSFTGTGFFITDDGYLISNYHVVKGAAKVRLLTGAGLVDATVVKVDAANDLALLKAVGRFAPLPIAASRTVKLGGTVATVGFPNIGMQGFAPKLAKGEIASLSGSQDDPRYFQISLPVQPGNSGGALVDARGNVVGIVAAKLDASAALAATGALPENVNYAVKSSLLLSFLESVPEVDAKLKEPNAKDENFEEVVKSAQEAAVLVLVY
jgi:S1-C subfamily serine protease